MNPTDRFRVWWACARYSFWLDLYCVRRKHRRGLRQDLKGNLTAAANSVGASQALENVGGVRRLAASMSRDGEFRSSWYAGAVAAFAAWWVVASVFLFASLYYIAGVMDTGVTERVTSTLWPFLGSTIEIQSSEAILEVGVFPGFMPFVAAAAVFVIVAKPWRSWSRSADSSSTAAPS